MNRVGHGGRGESVWLAWFLCRLVADFAPLARQRGDLARVQAWEAAAAGWQAALQGPAWDGAWYTRAFFDDGQPLGSHDNHEARIDLIAQAWAVLSGVAPPQRQQLALQAMDKLLADPQAGLVRLLDPPLVKSDPSAGYIQAYPPGVRENGGQYAHAAVWALMAQAALAGREAQATAAHSAAPGRNDIVWRYFTWLSPAHRAAHATQGPAYRLEPYVMAGDIYSQPPYVGQGGWSWYTGSAAWLHRAAIESIFGLEQGAQTLSLRPCLPSHWPQAELTLKRDGRSLRFVLLRGSAAAVQAVAARAGAALLQPGQALAWAELHGAHCFVIALPALAAAAPVTAAAPESAAAPLV
jgi:cyclic beta-1,2-glucan synthetase